LKDFQAPFTKLSRPYSAFKYFPGPGIMDTFFQGPSRSRNVTTLLLDPPNAAGKPNEPKKSAF